MGNSSSAANMEVARLENSVILLEDDYTTRYEDFDPDNAESYIIFSQMQNSFLNQSLEFAGELQGQFGNFAKRYDRGVKQAGFIVLWKTAMPSVLIEAGFICHPEEEKYISSEEGKGKLATSIFLAFCSYKTKIEERSSFRLGEHTPSNTRPQTDSATSKPQQETTTANIQPNPEMKTPKVEFCVQIGTSTKPKDTNPNNFHRYKNVERIQVSANYYKYIIGRTADYATARETMRNVRADFKDAFVAGIVNGKIVSATEAMKLINN
jgi:N-acetylmuramoyl-L-alanine amidase